MQPEGDKLNYPPIETIKRIMDKVKTKIIVKEVGQGMGEDSLRALLTLPIDAIETAAYGGSNFAKLELLRQKRICRTVFSFYHRRPQCQRDGKTYK